MQDVGFRDRPIIAGVEGIIPRGVEPDLATLQVIHAKQIVNNSVMMAWRPAVDPRVRQEMAVFAVSRTHPDTGAGEFYGLPGDGGYVFDPGLSSGIFQNADHARSLVRLLTEDVVHTEPGLFSVGEEVCFVGRIPWREPGAFQEHIQVCAITMSG